MEMRKRYEALSEQDKARIDDSKLVQAEKKLAELKEAKNTKKPEQKNTGSDKKKAGLPQTGSSSGTGLLIGALFCIILGMVLIRKKKA